MISLKSIDQSNWEACIELKPKQEQQGFIASNLYSIAESKFFPRMNIKAIYCGEKLLGFAMYGIDSDDGNYWIYRFMIDAHYQGRGHGKSAMKLDADVIILDPEISNKRAIRCYEKCGFSKVKKINNESNLLMEIKINKV
ncbi:GNAT family N-acetyltransferase [Lysinibacillus sp. TE18511]